MPHDLDRIADACIATVFHGDSDGYATLVQDLDSLELRRLGARLAGRAADALIGWAEDSGATPQQAAELWRRGILMRARAAEGEG